MKLKRTIVMVAIFTLIAGLIAPTASANAPYEAYTYNYYGDAVPLSAPYLPERVVTGSSLGVGNFNAPNDIFITEDGEIYILDSGNQRILVLNSSWRVESIIDSFENGSKYDSFSNPGGLFVSEKKEIYVADTDNRRVVVLDQDGKLIKIIENPQSDILPANFQFAPLKLTADKADRVFVIARGIYEGIMQFDENGRFLGYVGTIEVSPSLADRFWRYFSTDEQKARMQLFIPTEFASVDIDPRGFVYATNIDIHSQNVIKRLNPAGQDVIKRFGYYPNVGDIQYSNIGVFGGPSKLTDIKYLGGGMYTVLDSLRARLFTYNDEGELLYAFGGRGTQVGLFNTPVAVERQFENLVVLDRGKNNIVIFHPTEFGKNLHEATRLHYDGNSMEAVDIWRNVLRLNSNYDLAYIGIGKSLLMDKQNKEAMEYFKLGMQRKYYSLAFKRYRREMMQEHFSSFMTTLVSLIVLLVAYKIFKRVRTRRTEKREAGYL